MKEKKCSSTKIMYHITSQLQQWQNYMNCTSNCLCTHPVLQVWHPVCRPQKNAPEKDLAPMKKWYRKLRCIYFEAKDIVLQKSIIVREALESVYHPRRRLCWWKKVKFCLKVVLLVRPRTYWVVCYNQSFLLRILTLIQKWLKPELYCVMKWFFYILIHSKKKEK